MSSLCIIDISIKWILMFFLHCNQFWSEQDNLCMLLYVTYFIISCFIWKVMHVFVQSDRSHLTKVNCQSKKHYDFSQEFSEGYFI